MGQQSTPPVLEVTDLVAGYRTRQGMLGRRAEVHALSGVNMNIASGETLGLVGESGCGKSTLARTIVRLMAPTSGSVRFEGRDLLALRGKDLREMRRDIQMVFQDPYASLNPRMTVEHLIKEAWRIHPGVVPKQDQDSEVKMLLERVGLNPNHAFRYPHQ